MLVALALILAKALANALLLVILAPLALSESIFPDFSVEPLVESIRSIVDLFVWLFGLEAYVFFVSTVFITVFAMPTLSIIFFIFHLFSRSKGLVK